MKKILILGILLLSSLFGETLEKGFRLYELNRFKEAVEIFSKLCSENSVKSCFMIAYMLENGKGMEKDEALARVYYEKSCQGKFSSACFNLGLNYADTKEYNKAKLAFYNACLLSHKESCKVLAMNYEKEKDGNLASDFYQRACLLGANDACLLLARLYEKGEIVKQDSTKSAKIYRNACDKKDGSACALLARHFEILKQNNEAKKFYAKACDLGKANACENYKKLK